MIEFTILAKVEAFEVASTWLAENCSCSFAHRLDPQVRYDHARGMSFLTVPAEHDPWRYRVAIADELEALAFRMALSDDVEFLDVV